MQVGFPISFSENVNFAETKHYLRRNAHFGHGKILGEGFGTQLSFKKVLPTIISLTYWYLRSLNSAANATTQSTQNTKGRPMATKQRKNGKGAAATSSLEKEIHKLVCAKTKYDAIFPQHRKTLGDDHFARIARARLMERWCRPLVGPDGSTPDHPTRRRSHAR